MTRVRISLLGLVLASLGCPGAGNVTASAGADQTVASGASVTLDASGSRDSAGGTLTYAWTQTGGQNVSLSSASSAQATFTAPTVTSSTTLTFQVTVTNGKNSAAASTTVTVTPGGNGPVAVISGPTTAASGTTVTLDGSGSHGGTGTLSLSWAQSAGPTVALSSISGSTTSFTAPTVTSSTPVTIVLAAVDGAGNVGRTMTTITISPGGTGTPPTATPTANMTSVNSGATVTLMGAGTDPNSGATITGYQWAQTAGATVTLSPNSTAQNPTFTAPTVAASTQFTFTLVVRDSLGLSSTAAPVNVTVLPQGSMVPPTATPHANPTTVQSGGSVTLEGSGTDTNSGGSITGYTWAQTAGPTVSLSSTTAQNPTFTAPTVAANTTLTFSLVVTDNFSLMSTASTTSVTVQPASGGNNIKFVFVVVMENAGASEIYPSPLGSSTSTPYISGLMNTYGYATNYIDPNGLSTIMYSQPHYVWMEAGTNEGYTSDLTAVTSGNVTNSTAHLAAQLNTAGISWMSYQENLPASCPIDSSGFYAPKHDPFVWFADIVGTSPSTSAPTCSAHHKDFTALATDLASPSTMSKYNFITPNLCDDMHGNSSCSNGCTASGSTCFSKGDSWLMSNLPAIISFVNANQGVIFLVWDEPESFVEQPFLVIGPNVKAGGDGSSLGSGPAYTHSSLLKSEEEIFGLSTLSTVSSAPDFSAFFNAGKFP